MAETSGGISYPTVGTDPALIRATLQDMALDVQRELDKKLDKSVFDTAHDARWLGYPSLRRSTRTSVITGSQWLDLESPVSFAGGGYVRVTVGCHGGMSISQNNPRGFVGFRLKNPSGQMTLDAHADRSARLGIDVGDASWVWDTVIPTATSGIWTAQLTVFTDTNDGGGSIVMLHEPYMIVQAFA